MKFSDIQQDTPQLVVLYKFEGGQDRYQWGVTKGIPVDHLIGRIVRVQTELPYIEPSDGHYCPESTLVIAWDKDKKSHWFIHDRIPIDSIIGMLEMIKTTLVGSQLAQKQVTQKVCLVGVDGRPLRS